MVPGSLQYFPMQGSRCHIESSRVDEYLAPLPCRNDGHLWKSNIVADTQANAGKFCYKSCFSVLVKGLTLLPVSKKLRDVPPVRVSLS